VASASGRRQSSGRKTKPPASLSWIENTKSIDADRRTYFFNSIDPSRSFGTVNCRIAKGSFDHLVGAVIEAAAISEAASATAASTETTSTDQ
jgi:hypothetical protein